MRAVPRWRRMRGGHLHRDVNLTAGLANQCHFLGDRVLHTRFKLSRGHQLGTVRRRARGPALLLVPAWPSEARRWHVCGLRFLRGERLCAHNRSPPRRIGASVTVRGGSPRKAAPKGKEGARAPATTVQGAPQDPSEEDYGVHDKQDEDPHRQPAGLPGACRSLHNQLAPALLKILEFFSIFNTGSLRSSPP